jgi:hypothetical protein
MLHIVFQVGLQNFTKRVAAKTCQKNRSISAEFKKQMLNRISKSSCGISLFMWPAGRYM